MEGGSASLRQGNLVAQGPLIIALTGGNVVLDGGWTLTAEDTTNWTSGYIFFGSTFTGLSFGGTNTFVNAAGAAFDDQNTANYNIVQQAGSGVVDNAGLFDKTTASGASTHCGRTRWAIPLRAHGILQAGRSHPRYASGATGIGKLENGSRPKAISEIARLRRSLPEPDPENRAVISGVLDHR